MSSCMSRSSSWLSLRQHCETYYILLGPYIVDRATQTVNDDHKKTRCHRHEWLINVHVMMSWVAHGWHSLSLLLSLCRYFVPLPKEYHLFPENKEVTWRREHNPLSGVIYACAVRYYSSICTPNLKCPASPVPRYAGSPQKLKNGSRDLDHAHLRVDCRPEAIW